MSITYTTSTILTIPGNVQINGYSSRSSSTSYYGGYLWKNVGGN